MSIYEDGIGIQKITPPTCDKFLLKSDKSNKKEKEMSDKITIEINKDMLIKEAKVKKEKPAKIICRVDGELIEFKNEDKLKAFMWSERPKEVIRYDISGSVSVPFDLTTTPVK